ncbi:Nn.00g058560.m01.CDS01 [Neocucurbitaria sp. VM-36]
MFGTSGGLDALPERPRPSKLQQFVKEPCVFLASQLYRWRRVVCLEPIKPIAVVCLSNSHNSQPSDIPAGEILIHAGDITQAGTLKEIQTSLDWLNSLPHSNKIIIAGNHDIHLDHNQLHSGPAASASINWGKIIYLDSNSTTVTCENGRQLKIYSSPLTPRHGNWAFQYPRDQDVW